MGNARGVSHAAGHTCSPGVSEHDLARGSGLAFNEYECEVSTDRSSLGGGLVLSKLSVKRIQVILLRDIFRFQMPG